MKADITNGNFADWRDVKRGNKIGRTGDTGESTSIHLHFEVQRGGYPLNKTDPYDIYNMRGFYPSPCQPSASAAGVPQPDPGSLWTQCPPVPPVTFLTFVEGNPGIPGDGVFVSAAAAGGQSFELNPPLPLAAGSSDGLTVTVFPPPNTLESRGVSLTITNPTTSGPCRVVFGAATPFPTGQVSYNGVRGSYTNIPRGVLDVYVSAANFFRPGCAITLYLRLCKCEPPIYVHYNPGCRRYRDRPKCFSGNPHSVIHSQFAYPNSVCNSG